MRRPLFAVEGCSSHHKGDEGGGLMVMHRQGQSLSTINGAVTPVIAAHSKLSLG